METDIVCGVEIEMTYNGNILKLNKGSYHEDNMEHKLSKNFNIETDGSLRVFSEKYNSTTEIVSKPFKVDEWFEVLKEFKDAIIKKSKMDLLGEVIEFNSSCGAHIHFTVLFKMDGLYNFEYKNEDYSFEGKNLFIGKFASAKFFRELGDKIKDKVKEQMGEHFYKNWIGNYYRNFSKKVTEKNIFKKRYIEFNMNCGGGQVEYRSFHLNGVKTWGDFFKMYRIVFETLKQEIYNEVNKPTPFRQKLKCFYDINNCDYNEEEIVTIEMDKFQIDEVV